MATQCILRIMYRILNYNTMHELCYVPELHPLKSASIVSSLDDKTRSTLYAGGVVLTVIKIITADTDATINLTTCPTADNR